MKSRRGVSLTVAGDSKGSPPEKQGAMDQDDRDGLRAGGSENSGVATGHTKKLTNANIGEEGGSGDGAFTYMGIKYRSQSPREGDEEGRYDGTPLGRGEGGRGYRNKGTVLEGQPMFKHKQASRDGSLSKQPDPTLGYGLMHKGDGEDTSATDLYCGRDRGDQAPAQDPCSSKARTLLPLESCSYTTSKSCTLMKRRTATQMACWCPEERFIFRTNPYRIWMMWVGTVGGTLQPPLSGFSCSFLVRIRKPLLH